MILYLTLKCISCQRKIPKRKSVAMDCHREQAGIVLKALQTMHLLLANDAYAIAELSCQRHAYHMDTPIKCTQLC